VSRIKPTCNKIIGALSAALFLLAASAGLSGESYHSFGLGSGIPALQARVVIVEDPQAVHTFVPDANTVAGMFDRALLYFTRKPTVREAWLSLVATQDVIGLKVYSAPGPVAGTRPAAVYAVVRSLLAARIPATNIILWDKNLFDLKSAGFVDLARRFGVGVEGASEAGYDPKVYSEKPFIGFLVYGDLEFNKTPEGKGRKSFVSRLVTKRLTKIVNISPMLSHNTAGVSGNIFGLATGAADNVLRFESKPALMAEAVPDIYLLPEVGDRVVLNVVDALLCQYQGESQSLLHYSTVLNELRLSKDPVALDMLSLREINRQRMAAGMAARTNANEIYFNASIAELGTYDEADISIETVP
jgi:hypothetical protein